jgi:hypothetical protein
MVHVCVLRHSAQMRAGAQVKKGVRPVGRLAAHEWDKVKSRVACVGKHHLTPLIRPGNVAPL